MFRIEQSPLGRIVIPDVLPKSTGLFYTTIDFDGHLDTEIAGKLMAIMQDRFGMASTLNTCTQVHGANVHAAKRETKWRECDSCDALWTAERGVSLGIKVADCLPVTLVDPDHAVIANIHSGWRGAVQKITAAAIDTVMAGSEFASVHASAYLGPSIRVCCFEVGEEVVRQFTASYGDAERFVDRTHTKPHIDVAALTSELLRVRGFRPERIFDSGLCTRCDGSIFHSYRREGKGGGRNLAIVAQ